MYFVGLDLAWGERKPTGVAVVDDAGALVQVSAQTDDASILEAIKPYVADDCVVGIDAPLIVTNPTGNRPCEAALNKDFAKFQAGAHPSNTGKPEFANGTRGARLATATDLDLDPHSTRPRRALEVYPHAASVALFRLGVTLKYKHKKGRKFEELQSELLRMMDLIEGLKDADVPLRVTKHDDWQRLRREVETATRKSELRRAEDPVDAVLCAYVALYSVRRPDDVTVYGEVDTGYILTPTLPPGLTPQAAEPISTVARTAIAEYEDRRPALVAATANYRKLVTALLDDAGINYLSITARTKSVESFAAKAERTVDGRRLFSDPLVEITDQVGLRVITYLREDVDAVATLLTDEMRLLDDRDMGLETARAGRWGYASRHLLVGVEGEQQPASIQVRTVLQHAWAEFEHDIRYKGSIPTEHAPELDRRFTLAAGLLELADREFTAIRERLRVTMAGEETSRRGSVDRSADRDPGAGDVPGQPVCRCRLVPHRPLRLDLGPAAGTRHHLARRADHPAGFGGRRRDQPGNGLPLPARCGATPRRRATGRLRSKLSGPARQCASGGAAEPTGSNGSATATTSPRTAQ